MSKLGTHTDPQPTGIGDFLQKTHDAGSPVPALFALDIDISPDVRAKSPSTKIIFRTQKFGADNGNMYNGDPIAAGRARVDQCLPVLRVNPADWYAIINEPGRADAVGLTWICNFYLGAMQRADELAIKLCVGEWSTGMPPIDVAESASTVEWIDRLDARKVTIDPLDDMLLTLREQHLTIVNWSYETQRINGEVYRTEVDYISIYTPMLRYAAAHGHILGLHEYSLSGPMIGSPLCLRYRQLYAALPVDARPQIMISEAGPGAGYGTAYSGQAYIDAVAAYDAEVMKDSDVLGVALFKLGKGESDMSPVIPLLTAYVMTHPTPTDPPPPPPPPIITEHLFTNIVTQNDEAAAVLQTAIDDYGLMAQHYTRQVG